MRELLADALRLGFARVELCCEGRRLDELKSDEQVIAVLSRIGILQPAGSSGEVER
jgi:hypothetical protein